MVSLPPAKRLAGGFTLIELLVVVVLIAVVAGAAVLSLSGSGGSRNLEHEARRLAALTEYACEQALLLGLEAGLHLSTQGYHFSNYDGEYWQPFGTDTPLRAWRFAAALPGQLILEEQTLTLPSEPLEEPQVVCLASGQMTVFELDLQLAEDVYTLSGDWRGRVAIAAGTL